MSLTSLINSIEVERDILILGSTIKYWGKYKKFNSSELPKTNSIQSELSFTVSNIQTHLLTIKILFRLFILIFKFYNQNNSLLNSCSKSNSKICLKVSS